MNNEGAELSNKVFFHKLMGSK